MNEKQIANYCKKKGFGYNVFEDIAIITTKLGHTWEIRLEGGLYHVYHVNKSFNPGKKHHVHKQRIVDNLTFALQTVGGHDKYDKGMRHDKVFRMKELFNKTRQFA